MVDELMFERVFIKSEKSADAVWCEKIGAIKVGNASVEIEDVLEFAFVRSQGKNGPNKKNVFAPKEIPSHISQKLNEVLESEKSTRIQHLKQQVQYNTNRLTSLIEQYKTENSVK